MEKNTLHIAQADILLDESPVLCHYVFSDETLSDDFEVSGGRWRMEDGLLTGYQEEDGGALIYSRRAFEGDVLLDFCCRAVPPCKNDLNFTWRADGWDYARSDASRGYIGGLGGWWDGKAGMEKYPGCAPWAATALFQVEPGRMYHVQAGDVGGHCFLFVDGTLLLEMRDPNPETLSGCGRVGLGVYASHVQFSDLTVRGIRARGLTQTYSGG